MARNIKQKMRGPAEVSAWCQEEEGVCGGGRLKGWSGVAKDAARKLLQPDPSLLGLPCMVSPFLSG